MRSLIFCLGTVMALICLVGCSAIGYYTGKCCDRLYADSVSILPSLALLDLQSGDAVHCVLKDSSHIAGIFTGAGPWRNGDSLRFADGTTLVPPVLNNDEALTPDKEFFGLRVRTNSGIVVIDTQHILAILDEQMPATFRIILTTLGAVIDLVVGISAGMAGAVGAS